MALTEEKIIKYTFSGSGESPETFIKGVAHALNEAFGLELTPRRTREDGDADSYWFVPLPNKDFTGASSDFGIYSWKYNSNTFYVRFTFSQSPELTFGMPGSGSAGFFVDDSLIIQGLFQSFSPTISGVFALILLPMPNGYLMSMWNPLGGSEFPTSDKIIPIGTCYYLTSTRDNMEAMFYRAGHTNAFRVACELNDMQISVYSATQRNVRIFCPVFANKTYIDGVYIEKNLPNDDAIYPVGMITTQDIPSVNHTFVDAFRINNEVYQIEAGHTSIATTDKIIIKS